MGKQKENSRKNPDSRLHSYKSHRGISRSPSMSVRMDAAEETEAFDPAMEGFDYDKNKNAD